MNYVPKRIYSVYEGFSALHWALMLLGLTKGQGAIAGCWSEMWGCLGPGNPLEQSQRCRDALSPILDFCIVVLRKQ